MKKIYLLSVVFLLFMLGFVNFSNAQTVVFSEDFSSISGTGGNDGQWSGVVATGPLTDGDLIDWEQVKGFKGNECIKLGTSKLQGSITTPELTALSGNAVLTFKAGAWNGTNEKLVLLLEINGGGTLDQQSVTLVKGSFTNYVVNITGGTSATKITFKGEDATNSRFFLNNVVITENNMSVEDINVGKNKPVLSNTLISDQISVLLEGTSKVEFYSINGSLVKSVTVSVNQSINTQDLEKGVYLIRVVNGGKTETVKVIKK